MKGLEGKKVGIAADRSAEAISTLIEKQGGVPHVYSIQGRQQLDEQTSLRNVREFIEGNFDWVILTTGIGARTLHETAEKADLAGSFVQKLDHTKLAIRGSKTMSWLKQNNLQPDLVSEDGTMKNLLESLADVYSDHRSQHVFLQAYNEDDAKLKAELEKAGCTVYLSQPYFYEEPDPEVLKGLKYDIIEKSLDAVVFTSKTQVRNLFADQKETEELTRAFNEHVLAAAVGKVTAEALESKGITTVLQPESQKMGAMIVKIDRHFQEI